MILLAFLVQTLRIAVPYLFAAAGGVVSERAGLIALTLEIVAEKTGYPVEILRPDMHLQADLFFGPCNDPDCPGAQWASGSTGVSRR